MGRKYKNPPIVEAVCEFRFEPSTPWDLTIPGLMYEKFGNDFPKKKRVTLQQLKIETGPGGIEQTFGTSDGMRFSREDEKAFIQVAPDILSVHHLKPYPDRGWEMFFPLIQQGLDIYRQVAKPSGIRRIGLRYINRIEISGDPVKLEDYFNFYPFLGKSLPQLHGRFQVAVEIPYEEGKDILRVRSESVPGDTEWQLAVILDLDYFLARGRQLTEDNVLEWLDIVAHGSVENVFEACITDKLRKLFEEVPA